MKVPVRLRYRIWLEREGETVLGTGIAALLTRVRELGSLKKAAESLRMPYRGAWGRIRRAENALGMPLLALGSERQSGLSLTPEAEILIDAFLRLERKCCAELSQDAAGLPFLEVDVVHEQS